MSAEITRNSVVTLRYTVHDGAGELIDDGAEPLVYLHGGYGGVFFRLEEILHGRKQGEKLKAHLQPDDAFGEYDESLVHIEDIASFPENIEVGMSLERIGESGEDDEVFEITDIADNKVVIDGNHPLAGHSLVFDIEIVAIRPATASEIELGQVEAADSDAEKS